MGEYRPDDTTEQAGREFPRELELDPAGRRSERCEAPLAVQAAKRTILQRDDDRFRRMVRVVGREMRPDMVIVDVDARRLAAWVFLEDAGTRTPWQELRIELDVVDELEHRSGAEGHQHRLFYAAHGLKSRNMSIVDNRKAYHDYFIEERFEAGLLNRSMCVFRSTVVTALPAAGSTIES